MKKYRHNFTTREVQVIQLLAEGLTASEIALELGLAVGTIRAHRKNIFKKSDYKNTAELVAQCVRQGIV